MDVVSNFGTAGTHPKTEDVHSIPKRMGPYVAKLQQPTAVSTDVCANDVVNPSRIEKFGCRSSPATCQKYANAILPNDIGSF